MSSEEYINDMKIRSADLEYEYWTMKLEIVKKEKEAMDKLLLKISEEYKCQDRNTHQQNI